MGQGLQGPCPLPLLQGKRHKQAPCNSCKLPCLHSHRCAEPSLWQSALLLQAVLLLGVLPGSFRCWAAVLCRAVLCCAVLCRAVLCCAVLCCAVLCCAVLCFAVSPCVHSWIMHQCGKAIARSSCATLMHRHVLGRWSQHRAHAMCSRAMTHVACCRETCYQQDWIWVVSVPWLPHLVSRVWPCQVHTHPHPFP